MMQTAYQVLVYANKIGISLWLEEGDKLKYRATNHPETANTLKEIVALKPEIIDLLKLNHLHSENYPQPFIYREQGSPAVLSFAQERLWFIEQYEGGTNAYHVPRVYQLRPDANIKGIEFALQTIVSRHEVLRTTINDQDTGVTQCVHQDDFNVSRHVAASEHERREAMRQNINRPFDLSSEYPIRATLYRVEHDGCARDGSDADQTDEAQTLLLINMHHIATDGWSMDCFMRELQLCYSAYVNHHPSTIDLPELSVQYRDYALWQREYFQDDVLKTQADFWLDKLQGFETLNLQSDYSRPNYLQYEGKRCYFPINDNVSSKLHALSQQQGTTLHVILLSAFSIVLSKYSGQTDIVTGSPIANRHFSQLKDSIGYFVNTQVNRIQVDPKNSCNELFAQVHGELAQAQQHQDLPFEKLVELLQIERDPSRHPIFQTMFGVQSFGKVAEDEKQSPLIPRDDINQENEIAAFDLSLFIDCSEACFQGMISYKTSLFTPETIEQFIQHYCHVLEQIVTAPEQSITEVSLLTQQERQSLIEMGELNAQTECHFKSLGQYFLERVEQSPNQIAISYDEVSFTYQELNNKANQLAAHLRNSLDLPQSTTSPDRLNIGLLLDRSPEMIIAMLAILKCGSAYVPMDPELPKQRLEHIATDTNAALILTLNRTAYTNNHQQTDSSQATLKSSYQSFADKLLVIDLSEPFYQTEVDDIEPTAGPDDVAYVIYTSGTTGNPKGVLISHRNIASLVFNDFISIDSSDVFAFLSSPVFDAATFEIWTPLLHGSQLVVPSDAKSLLACPDEFRRMLDTHKVSKLWLTKTLFENLYSIKPDLFAQLDCLIIGGEALNKDVINYLLQSPHKPTHILNGYGPTESTTFTCVLSIEEPITTANVSIGRPIQGRSCYILDKDRVPVPVGIVGELYIGGLGLADGYLNNPELTQEKFIASPFHNRAPAQQKLYKTGDLARWLPDGCIEYIGRRDGQVKLRGYRIELSEIENQLKTLPGINQVAALVTTNHIGSGDNKVLVAYYTTNKQQSITTDTITAHLQAHLPEYMIPSALLELDELPLTINGKLNTRALGDISIVSEENYIAPNSDLEKEVCQIYAQVLGLTTEQISVNANFFAIGGNSILSIQLKHQLNKLEEFRTLSIADIFKYNTINKLIKSLGHANENSYKLQKTHHNTDHKIAIIGLSGSFTGAENIDDLWQLIETQQEGMTFLSQEECQELGVSEATLADDNYVPISTHIQNTEQFDPLFWGMSPNEAKLLDPQIRKFMEHSWATLESSGYITQRKSQLIGVFAGSGTDHYFQNNVIQKAHAGEVDMWEASVANRKDALATKTAYFLGLTGPANSINTACSTGLVSIVEACRNLQLGTCDMALAGGVSLVMPEEVGYTYSEGMIMARDGHCRPFDHDASGTIPGSGVAVVLLKPLTSAIKDQDNILGVISGYATNNDGDRKTGYTAPSLIGQSECVVNAHRMANISPKDIDYIECHGTATRLGDPIEVQALKEAFDHQRSDSDVLSTTRLGAIKANIGHTDAASGTVGVIKIVQMLQHQVMPGQTNYSKANSELNLPDTCFEISPQNTPWEPTKAKHRVAGVSSFGIGGTNAHVVIEDFAAQPKTKTEKSDESLAEQTAPKIIPISAKSRSSLESYRASLLNYVENNIDKPGLLDDLSFTLINNREPYQYRNAYVANSCHELVQAIKADQSYSEVNLDLDNHVIFMFPGQGTQYLDMGRKLYDSEPEFARIVDHCIALANPYLADNLHHVLFSQGEQPTHNINDTEWTQICLFVIEYSLAKLLQQMNIEADAYMGHSIGEYVAATLSGIFTLEDAIKVVIARGQLMQSMQPGKMLAVQAKLSQIESAVESHHCEISVINSQQDIVVSGLESDILALQSHFDKAEIASIFLPTSHAYHSRMMDEAADKFKQVLSTITIDEPCKPFVTNLTGAMATSNVQSAQYWCDQLRNAVRFSECIETISQYFDDKVTFIEVGTGKGLTSFVNKYMTSTDRKSIHAFNTLPSRKGSAMLDIKCKLDLAAILWKNNQYSAADLNTCLHHSSATNLADCPTYQFDHYRCWMEKSLNIASQNKLELLDKSHWYSTPQWATCKPLRHGSCEPLYHNALIIIRNHQEHSNIYSSLATSSTVVNLDIQQSEYSVYDNQIFINPENEDHFVQLQKHLNHGQYDAIIHAASVDNHEQLEPGLSYSFYSLFLTRMYLLNNPQLKSLLVVTNQIAQISNTETINSSNTTLVGAVRNIKHEYAHVNVGLIDIDTIGQRSAQYISQVFANGAHYHSSHLFAVKYGKLWQQSYHLVDAMDPIEESIIADNDTILVTGGMGGVALSIALAISEKHRVNFVLISRNDIGNETAPSRYIQQKLSMIEQIKANGSSVSMHALDIADPNQLNSNSLEHLIATHIDGIIHTAGVSPLAATEYDIKKVKSAFAGKVYGLDNILRSVDLTKLRYLASTSSLASIMGDVNRIEYCAANSYLDYLAADTNRFGDTSVIAINWPGWSDIGIVRNHDDDISHSTNTALKNESALDALMSLNSVKQQEGASIFYDLLQQPYAQIIVSKLDVNRLEEKLFPPLSAQEADSCDGVEIVEESYSQQEAEVAQLFADILGVEQLSLEDDFFRIGGNSILAIQLSHKLSRTLERNIKVADVFKHRTVKNILSSLPTEQTIDIPIVEGNRATLSFAQQRLWFIEQYEQGTNAYHIPTLYQLKPEVDSQVLKAALSEIVARHEILRSVIEQDDNAELATQVVRDKALTIDEVIVPDIASLHSMISQDKARPFDLTHDYPIRVKLYVLNPSKEQHCQPEQAQLRVLLINMHHIATDGWSMDIFHRELSELYQAYSTERPADLALLPIQYKDFAQWQRRYVQGDVLAQQLEYWKTKLTGFSTLELPTDYQRPIQVDYKGDHQKFTLNQEMSQAIRRLANEKQTTVHTVLLTACSVLLSKLANQNDVITGSPIANRHYSQTKDLIGLFINTQVNRVTIEPHQTFDQLIEHVNQDQIDGQQYQDVPFEKLVEELNIERDLSRHPIFQVMFGVQNFGLGDENKDDANSPLLPYQDQDHSEEIARFDLALFINDGGDEIQGHVSYKTSLFSATTISSYIEYFVELLTNLIHSPGREVQSLSLLSHAQRDTILLDWNRSKFSYPSQSTIAELFQRQVELNPNEVALVYRESQLTYRELNSRANALANVLRQSYKQRTGTDIQPGTLIPLCFDRGLEMVIAILAVFKSGGAYVPIDPHYPKERIDYILNDISAKLIVANRRFVQSNQSHPSPDLPQKSGVDAPLFFDDFAIAADLDEPCYQDPILSNPPPFSAANDLAYVIYTSGTTGNPKGVMVSHRSLAYYTHVFIKTVEVDTINSAFLLNYCFDASLPTIFSGLLTSGRTTILDNLNEFTSQDFVAYLKSQNINTLRLTPSMLMSCKDELVTYDQPLSLVLGGEPIHCDAVNQMLANDNVKLFNQYGPTECTVGSTVKPISTAIAIQNIGQPYPGKRVYILDQSQQLCPIGQVGELYIGGEGLAEGYLNRAELNQQRFIDNPFSSDGDKQHGFTRLYKTGDLARWQPNGDIEYFGRNDDQVKLRGYRIELGEIEHAIVDIDGVKEACVLLQKQQTGSQQRQFLIGYYRLEEHAQLTETMISEQLSQRLPEYMLPTHVVQLESFPLTPNGKLDKKALPIPTSAPQETYEAPTNDIETEICAIWTEILGVEQVGVTDDFFKIGGDSISSIQIASRIRKIGFNCQVKSIFEYRTIRRLCEHLGSTQAQIEVLTEQGTLTGEVGLLPIQEWFVSQVRSGNIRNKEHWNQSFMVKVPKLDVRKVASIIGELIEYHDMLRVRYTLEDSVWRQHYHDSIVQPELKVVDVNHYTESELNALLTEWQSHFDLTHGPLFQVVYLHGYPDSSARLFFSLHHLIVDSVSWRIVIDHIKTLYSGGSLEKKGTSYRQWVNEISNYPKQHPTEDRFWQKQVTDLPDYRMLLDVADDQPAQYHEISISAELTSTLVQIANRPYHTEINDLLLTALAFTLQHVTGVTQHGITLEGHGRENISEAIDHSHTLGWFTSKFPVKLSTNSEIGKTITTVKHQLRSIPNKGVGFGAFACDPSTGSYSFNDLPEVSFNYLGRFDSSEGNWQVVNEDSGNGTANNQILNIININGMINDGQLRFGIHSKMSDVQSKAFSESLKTELENIVYHCCEEDKRLGYIAHPESFNDFVPFEVVNEDIAQSPIFILPPGGGGAESFYNNLVPDLAEKKLVLFNNYYDFLKAKQGDSSTDQLTFERLAKFYIDYIKQLQADGPYTLVGWSFGGLLAFEITKQLSDLGDKVNHLILLDSYFNYQQAWNHSLFTDVSKFENNVNYQYQPERFNAPYPLDITLFKAKQVDEQPIADGLGDNSFDPEYAQKYRSIHAYYVNQVEDNHINQYVSQANLHIVPMEASHNNWVNNHQVIQQIVSKIAMTSQLTDQHSDE
nr:non-ribosomal peptide synthetase/type I polyketide synthase [Vibrio coralliilyticus]